MKYISAQVAEPEDMTEAQGKRLDELVRMMEAKSELPEDDVNMFDLTVEDQNKDLLLLNAVKSTIHDFLGVRNLASCVLRNHGVHLDENHPTMASYKKALLLKWAVENFNPAYGSLLLDDQDYNLDTFARLGLDKEKMFQLFERIAKLNFDKAEIALLNAAIIFTPEKVENVELRTELDRIQKEYFTLFMRKSTLPRLAQAQRILEMLEQVVLEDQLFSSSMLAQFPKLNEIFPDEGGKADSKAEDGDHPLPFPLPLGPRSSPHDLRSCQLCSQHPDKLRKITSRQLPSFEIPDHQQQNVPT